MEITIVKRSELNNCWSPYQYTNNCKNCDKILTCKVKSKYHEEGLIEFEKIETARIEKKIKDTLTKLKDSINKTLTVIQ